MTDQQPPDSPWPTRAAYTLAGVLLVTGTLHFLSPGGFESIVPRFLGSAAFWVRASGVAELGCAVGLLVPSTRSYAGRACVVLFVAVFPANVQMAVDARGTTDLLVAWLRLPLQVPLVLWALYVARRAQPVAGSGSGSGKG